VEKELAAAEKYFALNTLRVYLHPINFEQDKKNLLKNLETFIRICAAHGISPGFTFFDDCHRHEGIYLDRPTEPVKGYHNGRWAASPQDRDRDINNLERYKPYIQEIIAKYAKDSRVLWWETFNEPNKSKWSVAMRKAAYRFAKEANPQQPVICCWDNTTSQINDCLTNIYLTRKSYMMNPEGNNSFCFGTDILDHRNEVGDVAQWSIFANWNTNSRLQQFNNFYNLISMCNQLLYGAEQLTWPDESSKARIVAEGRFLRGYFYLNLAELCGRSTYR
jgi:hypothetical protein